MKIPLTQGLEAIIDEEDAERILPHRWHASKKRNTFYACRKVGPAGAQVTIYMHRFLLGVSEKNVLIDHKNGNGLDNRRENLRVATNAQNQRNRTARKDSKSGVKGVYASRSKKLPWRAEITVDGKNIHLGNFSTIEEATEARATASFQYHGDYSRR